MAPAAKQPCIVTAPVVTDVTAPVTTEASTGTSVSSAWLVTQEKTILGQATRLVIAGDFWGVGKLSWIQWLLV